MAHLTKRLIDSAAYQGNRNSRDVRWDDDPHGLGLRIYSGGRKAFVVSYRATGTKRLMTLGDYGVLTLEQARKAARSAMHAVESRQMDPLLERRQATHAARDRSGNLFRETKGGGDHSVPLSTYAMRLLQALPRIEGNPYVFAGRTSGSHLVAPDKAWCRIRSRAGLPHLRMHDLRRTFGSWLGDAGFTSKQIGLTLGHKTDITSRVYMALGEGCKRAAVNAVEQFITGKAA